MIYPNTPSFASPGSDISTPNAWWTYNLGSGKFNICQAEGAAVLKSVRAALGLSQDAVWDNALQSALIARAQQLNAAQPGVGWDTLTQVLQQGLAAQRVDATAMRFALWLAYYQRNSLRLDAIGVTSQAVFPTWGQRVADGPSGNLLVCYDPSRDTSPTFFAQSDLVAAAQQSTDGIRIHPGESIPQLTQVPPGPAGLSVPVVLAIGAGILILTAGIVSFGNK